MEEAEKYIRVHSLFSLVKNLMRCFSSFLFARYTFGFACPQLLNDVSESFACF